ncbi:hypothetical protein LZ30DRAFT_738679 [Colletotrichum cereale]|nr:hypothetical protein LZ30DRAFT_738679 [Colletotrichum cereale]
MTSRVDTGVTCNPTILVVSTGLAPCSYLHRGGQLRNPTLGPSQDANFQQVDAYFNPARRLSTGRKPPLPRILAFCPPPDGLHGCRRSRTEDLSPAQGFMSMGMHLAASGIPSAGRFSSPIPRDRSPVQYKLGARLDKQAPRLRGEKKTADLRRTN